MKWTHQVRTEWLMARKKYLSASDVKKLIPVTASGRPRANMDEAYLKVWAEKHSFVTEDDINSSGPMARGHLLEPYAIAEFNKIGVMPCLYHWDDTVIHNMSSISCSPDSLDVPNDIGRFDVDECEVDARYMGEVKAYGPAPHYQTGLADKMTLDERWQIATAFYTMPGLEEAALILFNPNTEHPLFWHKYTRADLADEIGMVEDVILEYSVKAKSFLNFADVRCSALVRANCISEQEIIDILIEEQEALSGLTP